MAIQYSGIDISLLASEDLSSHQYRFVHQAADGTADLLDSGAEPPIGILQNDPVEGEVAVIRVVGTSKLVMNDAVANGVLVKAEYVGATDNGKGDAADTEGDIARGMCIEATGAEDDVGGVILCINETSVPA